VFFESSWWKPQSGVSGKDHGVSPIRHRKEGCATGAGFLVVMIVVVIFVLIFVDKDRDNDGDRQ